MDEGQNVDVTRNVTAIQSAEFYAASGWGKDAYEKWPGPSIQSGRHAQEINDLRNLVKEKLKNRKVYIISHFLTAPNH